MGVVHYLSAPGELLLRDTYRRNIDAFIADSVKRVHEVHARTLQITPFWKSGPFVQTLNDRFSVPSCCMSSLIQTNTRKTNSARSSSLTISMMEYIDTMISVTQHRRTNAPFSR